MKKIAVIDLGSNSVRMSIFSTDRCDALKTFRSVIRLSEGMAKTSQLSPAAQLRAVKALEEYKTIMESEKTDICIAVATAAVRKATNKDEFLNLVKDSVGIDINVISGKTEAALDALAVKRLLGTQSGVICDIGGGSTELIGIGNNPANMFSFPHGSRGICENFFASGETPDSINKALAFASSMLDSAAWLESFKGTPIVGIGGTLRTVARIGVSPASQDATGSIELVPSEINSTLKLIEASDFNTRLSIPEIGADRADIIMGGAIILKAILSRISPPKIIVADIGVREGVFFDFVDDLGILKTNE